MHASTCARARIRFRASLFSLRSLGERDRDVGKTERTKALPFDFYPYAVLQDLSLDFTLENSSRIARIRSRRLPVVSRIGAYENEL